MAPLYSFVLAVLSICTLSWTITQEEIFKEFREWCSKQRTASSSALIQKILYLPTCHYCMSFWLTGVYFCFVPLPKLWILPIIWTSNVIMTAYGLLRQQQKKCSLEAKHHELLYLQKQIEDLNRQMSSAKLMLPGRGVAKPPPPPDPGSPEFYRHPEWWPRP